MEYHPTSLSLHFTNMSQNSSAAVSRSVSRAPSRAGDAPEGGAPSKRLRSGTVVGSVDAPLSALGSDVPEPMEEDLDVSDDMLVFVGVTHVGECAVRPKDQVFLAALLGAAWEGQAEMGNVVLTRYILADDVDRMPLTGQVERAFGVGLEPLKTPMDKSYLPMTVWSRDHQRSQRIPKALKARPLLPFHDSQRSMLNRSFALMTPVAYSWPPPLLVGPEDGCNVAWVFKVKDLMKERRVLLAIRNCLEARWKGGIYKRVCPHFNVCIAVA